MCNPHRRTFCMAGGGGFGFSAVIPADSSPLALEQDDASGHPNDGRYTQINRDRLIIRAARFAVVGRTTVLAFDVGK
jgi:hypothetical protein